MGNTDGAKALNVSDDLKSKRGQLESLRKQTRDLEREITKALHARLSDAMLAIHNAKQTDELLADVRDFLDDERP